MTTNYAVSDILPRDGNNRTFSALINTASSDLDFALQKGIGASTISSKIQAHMAVATHTQGSAIEAGHPGVAVMGVYLDDRSASPVGNGQGNLLRSSLYGELLVAPRAKTYAARIATAASTYIITATSANVHNFMITFSGGSAADNVILQDGDNSVLRIINSSENENHVINFGGVYFASGIKIAFNTITQGAASATIVYD